MGMKGSLQLLKIESEEAAHQIGAELTHHQAQPVEAIGRCKMVAPNKKLPEDVLRYIFTFCCPIETRFPLRRNNVQLVLCAVCSAWRTIALDTPRLWNEVITTVGDPSTCSILLMVVQSWLARASSMPRSLRIRWKPSAEQGLLTEMGLLTQLLSAYPYRKIHLSLCSRQSLQRIVSGLRNDTLSHLEDLALVSHSKSDRNSDSGPFPLLFDSSARLPNLASLDVANRQWNCQSLKTAIVTWHKLRYLNVLPSIPASFCFEILRKGSSLNYCRLTVKAESTFVTSYPSLTGLNCKIQYLYLLFENNVAAEPFIHLLVLSTILVLELNSSTTLGCTAIELARMARRSQMKSIKTFRVGICDGPLNVAIVLQSMPSLNELDIYGEATLGDKALRDLGAGILGRHLRTIKSDDVEFLAQLRKTVTLRKFAAESDKELPNLLVVRK